MKKISEVLLTFANRWDEISEAKDAEKLLDQALSAIHAYYVGKIPEKKYLIDNMVDDLDEMVKIKDRIEGYNQSLSDCQENIKKIMEVE